MGDSSDENGGDTFVIIFLLFITIMFCIVGFYEYFKYRNKMLDSIHNSENGRIADFKKVIIVESYSENQCSICCESISQFDLIRYLKCLHYFHDNCINDWLKKGDTCPICRMDIDE